MAQESWTLEACIDHALEHNLLLNDFQYNNDANKEDYRQSIRNLLPEVNAGSNYKVNSVIA